MRFVDDEGGFSTPAAAVALLLVFALLALCARGISVGTRSGQIQYVADAGALAADKVVAEYVAAGQVVDALLLSCSLASVTVYAASAAVSFIPGGAPVAARLSSAGRSLLKTRNKLAKSANECLEKVQAALPALAAVRAASCVQANAQASGISYVGFAITCPLQGMKAEIPEASDMEESFDKMDEQETDAQKRRVQTDTAQKELDAAKLRAWNMDCGKSGMNMRERAGHLAGLSPALNPNYRSVEDWSFSVPLRRAKAYYRARLDAEPGGESSGSPELVGESVARKAFYRYALSEVSKGSVGRSASGGERPDLKELARNTEGIKQTFLYDESIYPVSRSSKGTLTLHAYSECPVCKRQQAAGKASVHDIERGKVKRCDQCKFSVRTLGRVPSASTSIDNGFEYYYRAVVEASRAYNAAQDRLARERRGLESSKKGLVSALKSALQSAGKARFDPQPPGRYGCVCIVMSPRQQADKLPFLKEQGTLPYRVALSGATLAPDTPQDGATMITDAAAGLIPDGSAGGSLARSVVGAWSGALDAYKKGNEGLLDAFDRILGSLPLVGDDLSEWACKAIRDALDSAGLEPCDMSTYKPVLVNTSRVIERDEGAAAEVLRNLKRTAEIASAVKAEDFKKAVDLVGECPSLKGIVSDKGLVLARITLTLFGQTLANGEITMPAPQDLQSAFEQAVSALENCGGGP